MTDHAGPRRYKSHVVAPARWSFCARGAVVATVLVFVKPNKNKLSVWSQTVTWIIFNNFCFILLPRLLINIIFFDLTKNGRKNRSWAQKLCYFDSYRRGPAWSYICNIYVCILRVKACLDSLPTCRLTAGLRRKP